MAHYESDVDTGTAESKTQKTNARLVVEVGEPDPGTGKASVTAVYRGDHFWAADTTFAPWVEEWQAPVTVAGKFFLRRLPWAFKEDHDGNTIGIGHAEWSGDFEVAAAHVRDTSDGHPVHDTHFTTSFDFGPHVGRFELRVEAVRSRGVKGHVFDMPRQTVTFGIKGDARADGK
ncbi:hypothetical protein [Streptomyces sp. NPDC051567]|uniref:hypothetical protein n=1 Tax=Streptomyces sp. NPDC051567 TaxID=3365660 RepID=UPI0037938CC6